MNFGADEIDQEAWFNFAALDDTWWETADCETLYGFDSTNFGHSICRRKVVEDTPVYEMLLMRSEKFDFCRWDLWNRQTLEANKVLP
jgi:hypothetical protein